MYVPSYPHPPDCHPPLHKLTFHHHFLSSSVPLPFLPSLNTLSDTLVDTIRRPPPKKKGCDRDTRFQSDKKLKWGAIGKMR